MIRNDTRLLVLSRKKNIYSFFDWWTKAWIDLGGKIIKDGIPRTMAHTVLGRMFNVNFAYQYRLVVLSEHRIERTVWPWNMFCEIIPVMWDIWPDNRDAFVKFLKRNHVKTAFCTSSQEVEYIQQRVPNVEVFWMPEGIDVSSYPCGPKLIERKIDLLNYGRKKKDVIDAIDQHKWFEGFNFKTGRGSLLFSDFDELVAGIGNAKITICYPQCDTSPEKAGNIETLTQRYWECMLCGTIIVGRAPQELIHLCGYNPVIELGNDPCGKIEQLLSHIDNYQDFADRNRKAAETIGPWLLRVQEIMRVVNKNQEKR